jgi:hypothetical protein
MALGNERAVVRIMVTGTIVWDQKLLTNVAEFEIMMARFDRHKVEAPGGLIHQQQPHPARSMPMVEHDRVFIQQGRPCPVGACAKAAQFTIAA